MLLALDTSTPVCSVCLFADNEVLAYHELRLEKSHSEHLVPIIQHMLETCSIKPHELGAVVVGKGPGSYTGLRIGSSVAKSLCFSLEIPLISVGSLEAIGKRMHELGTQLLKNRPFLVCAMLDARRMEVYTAAWDDRFEEILPVQALVVEADSLEKLRNGENVLILGGNGAKKVADLWNDARVLYLDDVIPSAKELAFLGWEKLKKQEFEDSVYFEPIYLKEFEVKKKKGV